MYQGIRPAAALAAVLSAVLLAACSTTTKIDANKAAGLVQSQIHGNSVKVKSVTCPSGITAKTGGTFNCTVTFADGTSGTTGIKMTDDKGDIVTLGGLHINK